MQRAASLDDDEPYLKQFFDASREAARRHTRH